MSDAPHTCIIAEDEALLRRRRWSTSCATPGPGCRCWPSARTAPARSRHWPSTCPTSPSSTSACPASPAWKSPPRRPDQPAHADRVRHRLRPVRHRRLRARRHRLPAQADQARAPGRHHRAPAGTHRQPGCRRIGATARPAGRQPARQRRARAADMDHRQRRQGNATDPGRRRRLFPCRQQVHHRR